MRTPGGSSENGSAKRRHTPGGSSSQGTGPPRPPPTHLLGLLGEGVGRSHHHVGAGVRVLRQVDAGHPLQRREERRVSGPQCPARPLPASPPPGPALTQFLALKYCTHREPSAPLPPYTSTLPAAMPAAPALLSPARMGRPRAPWVVRGAGLGRAVRGGGSRGRRSCSVSAYPCY